MQYYSRSGTSFSGSGLPSQRERRDGGEIMSRFAVLITKYQITIETLEIDPPFHYSSDIPYTLHYANRSSKGKMLAKTTLSCEEALHSEFAVANMRKDIPSFEKIAWQTEKKLRRFLGNQYDEFWQAYLLDIQEQRRR
jgi:hypothetical protein